MLVVHSFGSIGSPCDDNDDWHASSVLGHNNNNNNNNNDATTAMDGSQSWQ
jgi:hypothetical protein